MGNLPMSARSCALLAFGATTSGRSGMNTYVILRRSGWRSAEELGEAAERSRLVGDEQMPDDVRWIRSYVLDEGGGSVGTVCIYQATSPEAIRRHASVADLPVDEIIAVADTVIVRPDPRAGGRHETVALGEPGSRCLARSRARRCVARPRSARAALAAGGFGEAKSATAALPRPRQGDRGGLLRPRRRPLRSTCIAQPGEGAMGDAHARTRRCSTARSTRTSRRCSCTRRGTTAR